MILIPVSLGELLDKISILQIKETNIKDTSKLEWIKKELALLIEKLREINHYDLLIDQEFRKLVFYNKTLWNLEDNIRLMEKQNNFGQEFIRIARSIYINNDKRCEIKRYFNEKYSSHIMEIKSYN
jgi:hypothetical protein